jgi:hypothetical protein
MLQYLLKSSDLSGILRFVSPNLLSVISPKMLYEVITTLKRNHSRIDDWNEVCSRYSSVLNKDSVAVALVPQKNAAMEGVSSFLAKKEAGERVLTLFFHQILTQEYWVLDFRSQAFFQESESNGMSWRPKALYFHVAPKFVESVRNLYRGFYLAEDHVFDQALSQMGLLGARASLHKHFGQGDQSDVAFKLKVFQSTFTEVFEVCAKEKIRLDRDFLILGLMLLALYENLESLDHSFDVRGCFMDALRKAGLS